MMQLKRLFRCKKRGQGYTKLNRMYANFHRMWMRFKKHLKDLFVTFVTNKEDIHELTYRLAESGGVKRSTFLILGTFFRAGYFIVFIYLTYSNYMALRHNQKFVSLSKTSGDCKYIAKNYILPEVTASYDGLWDTDRNFLHSRAMYSFSLYNFEANFGEYDSWMALIKDEIDVIGKKAVEQILPSNLLYWSFWFKDIPVPNGVKLQDEHVFSFNGAPNALFNVDQIKGTVSNEKYDCPTNSSIKTYDNSKGKLSITYSHQSFKGDNQCKHIMDPTQFGYSYDITEDTFQIDLDTTTALTAVSVNEGIIAISDLVFISNYEKIKYNNIDFVVDLYYYREYSMSDYVYCVGPENVVLNNLPQTCMLKIGETFAVPYFHHFGSSKIDPDQCSCSAANGNSESCNDFNFLVGAFFYDWKKRPDNFNKWQYKQLPLIPILELFYGPNAITYKAASDGMYYVSWLSATESSNNTHTRTNYHDSTVFRENSYVFSNTSYGTASVIGFHTYSLFGYKFLNFDGYHLNNGSCVDSFNTPHFQSLITKPWGDLVEPYYECTYFAKDAFLNGTGIASGTVQTFLPSVVFLIMFSFIFPNVLRGINYGPDSEKRENFEYTLNKQDIMTMSLITKLGKSTSHSTFLEEVTKNRRKSKKLQGKSGSKGSDDGIALSVPPLHSLLHKALSTSVSNPNSGKDLSEIGSSRSSEANSQISNDGKDDFGHSQMSNDGKDDDKILPGEVSDGANSSMNIEDFVEDEENEVEKKREKEKSVKMADFSETAKPRDPWDKKKAPKNSKVYVYSDIESNSHHTSHLDNAKLEKLMEELHATKAKIENAESKIIKIHSEIRSLKATVTRIDNEINHGEDS